MELTDEEVLHVANLANIFVNDDEMDSYKKELKQIMNEIDRINELNVENDIMVSPSENINVYREDDGIETSDDVLSNAPKRNGNYVEIKRFVND